jgi:proline dehydrogenase
MLLHFINLQVYMTSYTTNGSSKPAGELSFENTEIAFRHSSNSDLRRAYWLFRLININFLVKIGPPVTNFAIKIGLPVKGLIKATIFKHFCGGETIEECAGTIKNWTQAAWVPYWITR